MSRGGMCKRSVPPPPSTMRSGPRGGWAQLQTARPTSSAGKDPTARSGLRQQRALNVSSLTSQKKLYHFRERPRNKSTYPPKASHIQLYTLQFLQSHRDPGSHSSSSRPERFHTIAARGQAIKTFLSNQSFCKSQSYSMRTSSRLKGGFLVRSLPQCHRPCRRPQCHNHTAHEKQEHEKRHLLCMLPFSFQRKFTRWRKPKNEPAPPGAGVSRREGMNKLQWPVRVLRSLVWVKG